MKKCLVKNAVFVYLDKILKWNLLVIYFIFESFSLMMSLFMSFRGGKSASWETAATTSHHFSWFRLHPQQVFTTFLQEEPTYFKAPFSQFSQYITKYCHVTFLDTYFSGPSALFNQNFIVFFDRMIQVIVTCF